MTRLLKRIFSVSSLMSLATMAAVGWFGWYILFAGHSQEREKLPAPVAEEKPADGRVRVTVQPVAIRSVQRIVGIVGTLHGYEEFSLATKVEGRVRKISHDVGDRVRPGDVLLEIDPTDLQLSMRQSQKALQVELAKLGLTEAPAGKVDITRVPTVVQAQLRRENAEKRVERTRGLVAKKAGTEEDLTEKISELRVAQAEYDNQVLIARAGIATIQMKSESLSMARQQLQDTVIKVPEPSQPIPGVDKGATYAITSRPVSEGSYLAPGTEVFKIVIEQPLKFRGRVPERKIADVQLGQRAEIVTAAYSRTFPGEVTRINPAVDPETRTFEVEVLVPNAQNELKPGGFAKIGILTNVDEQAATVPLEALVYFAGVTKIFLVEGDQAKEVQVTLGVQGTEWVEIASPKLTAGAQVVTTGQTAIADGTPVTIRSDAGHTPESLAKQRATVPTAETAAEPDTATSRTASPDAATPQATGTDAGANNRRASRPRSDAAARESTGPSMARREATP